MDLKDYSKIDMKIKLYQKFFIEKIVNENQTITINECKDKFKNIFKDIEFKLSDDIIKKIICNNNGKTQNLSIEEICRSLEKINNNITIEIFPINTEYKRANNIKEKREQNIIIISTSDMIKYLDYNNSKMYGIDITFKIIPRSFKPYKLMTIYTIDKEKKSTIICALICLKYNDEQSLIKIFSLLRAYYNFSPSTVTLDFDRAQINSLKKIELFKNKPYLITCLFHFGQALFRKLQKLKMIKNKLNKRGYEIIKNLEILCFIDKKNITKYFDFLKSHINKSIEEKKVYGIF